MLSNPKIGQRVVLHYREQLRGVVLWHGKRGVVIERGTGKPRNHLVQLTDGTRLVVPAGNLKYQAE